MEIRIKVKTRKEEETTHGRIFKTASGLWNWERLTESGEHYVGGMVMRPAELDTIWKQVLEIIREDALR